jgi:hypothetical protein
MIEAEKIGMGTSLRGTIEQDGADQNKPDYD